MNVMQALIDFKHSLRPPGQAATSGVAAGKQATAGARFTPAPADSSGSTASSSGNGSTTITANDFLQLLVAEMKNQDPTSNQDPNEYIDQLVQVNSLQQLIAINQDLTPSSNSGTSSSATGGNAAQGGARLGSAANSPAASVANALVPRPAQPEHASGGSGHPASTSAVAPRRPRTARS